MSVVPQPEGAAGDPLEWSASEEAGGAEPQGPDLARLRRLGQLEKALRHGEDRLALAMSASRGGFWEAACVGSRQVMFGDECCISPEQKRIIGYDDHEFPNSGLAWFERVVPEDLAAFYQAIQQHYDSRTPLFQSEYRIRHRDGTLRWVEARGKLILDEDGLPRRCTGVVWDITERKTAESNYSQLEAVINSMSDGVIICAADGRIVRMNSAAKDLYGFQGPDVPRTLADLRRRVELRDPAGALVAQEEMPLPQVLAG